MAFVPSPQQTAYFDFLRTSTSSLVLEAAAGAGKSTTICQGLGFMPGSVYVGAYNKAAATDLQKKVRDLGLERNGLFVGTMHSAGFSAWRRFAPNVKVNENKMFDIMDAVILSAPRPDDVKLMQTFILKMVSIGKQMLCGVTWQADNTTIWTKLADHFGYDSDLPENLTTADCLPYVIQVFNKSRSMDREQIDYDDMISSPLAHNARFFQNDYVVIDEAQDTNPARRELAKRMLKRTGRLIAVGDRYQAIYGFCHPPGVKVMTPDGDRNIEDLQVGDPIIAVNTSGDVAGWAGNYKVLATTKHQGWDHILELVAGEKSVKMTPHHRVPVRMPEGRYFFTYVMERDGYYRVGYMASHSGKARRFMLSQRCVMEGADRAWVLRVHATRHEAIIDEAQMHAQGVFGGSFTYMTQDQIRELDSDPGAYHALIKEAGRMVDFPFWEKGKRMHFEAKVPAILEACNILPGMSVQVVGQWDMSRPRAGRSRQHGEWTPVSVVRYPYDPESFTYGITVTPLAGRDTYVPRPLYVADGIIVHNTGADADALDLIAKEFHTELLPLSVTYRCPKQVVAYAQQFVPLDHIEAHETAPEGDLRDFVPQKDASGNPIPWFRVETLRNDDAILCRYTKPLVKNAFAMIRAGIACKVEGRDIGKGLIALATRWKVKDFYLLEEKLDAWLAREVEKAKRKRSETAEQSANDRRETLQVFIDRCRAKGSDDVSCLVTEINALFADNVTGVTTLCTGHKSKGREWKRVYWLQVEEWERANTQDWQRGQERNLKYVMATRAMEELVLISPEAQK